MDNKLHDEYRKLENEIQELRKKQILILEKIKKDTLKKPTKIANTKKELLDELMYELDTSNVDYAKNWSKEKLKIKIEEVKRNKEREKALDNIKV